MEPAFKFDVNVSKFTSNDKILWKSTINKGSFPNINVTETPKLYHLDEQNIEHRFNLFLSYLVVYQIHYLIMRFH